MTDFSAYHYVTNLLSPEDGSYYLVTFLDIPGCLGVGETEAEAIEDGQNALKACIDALLATDREPPVPSSGAA